VARAHLVQAATPGHYQRSVRCQQMFSVAVSAALGWLTLAGAGLFPASGALGQGAQGRHAYHGVWAQPPLMARPAPAASIDDSSDQNTAHTVWTFRRSLIYRGLGP
jgi:hypothetical protein